jgi:WD40 repeat protein
VAEHTNSALYMDRQCAFPRITTTILEAHTDEVWNMEWSHDGAYLASASKDKTAIIWRIGVRLPRIGCNIEYNL